jgi:hypothetical protein
MPKRSSKGDINETAFEIVQRVTGAAKAQPEKNPAAVALGRLGGLKGGRARADSLPPSRRKAIAKRAAMARWGKKLS